MIKSLFPWRQPRETIEDVRAQRDEALRLLDIQENQVRAMRLRIADLGGADSENDVLHDRLDRITKLATPKMAHGLKRAIAIAHEPLSVRQIGRNA